MNEKKRKNQSEFTTGGIAFSVKGKDIEVGERGK